MKSTFLLVVLLACQMACTGVRQSQRPVSGPLAPKTPKGERLALRAFRVPVVFEQNNGHAPESVSFVVRRLDHAVFFRRGDVVFSAIPANSRQPLQRPDEIRGSVIAMRLVGAQDRGPRVEREIGPRGRYIGIRGGPKRLMLAASIVYTGIYPGVDLRFHDAEGRLRYEFVLAPRASVQAIRLRFPEARRIGTDRYGNLEIETSTGTLRHSAPRVYAAANGSRRAVRGQFAVLSSTEVGFTVAGARSGETIHIDPELSYSTYLGGTESVVSTANVGNPLVSAYGSYVDVYFQTASAGLPGANSVTQSDYAAVLFRFDRTAPQQPSVVFMVVFPSNFPAPLGLGSASDGSVYVLGQAPSGDNIGVPPDAIIPMPSHPTASPFVARVEPDGTVQRITYMWSEGSGTPFAIAVEADGPSPGVYMIGSIAQAISVPRPYLQNPVRPAANDQSEALVVKTNLSLSQLQYVTFLGGTGRDAGIAIAVRGGRASTLVHANSSDYPVTAGAYQSAEPPLNARPMFLTTLDQSGAIAVSGFLGYNGREVDTYTTGEVVSGPYEHSPSGGPNDVIKITQNGNSLVYRTAALPSPIYDLAPDNGGGAWVGGLSREGGHATPGAIQPSHAGGNWDAFVALHSATGSLDYFTYLGGERWEYASSIARQPGFTFVTGLTTSAHFPVTSTSALQPTLSGVLDAFFAILSIVPVQVTVTKDDSPDQINANGHVTYTVNVSNTGATSLNGLTILDQADPDLVLFPPQWQGTGTLPGWSSDGQNSYSSTNVSLASGQSLSFTVEGVGLTGGTFQNCVRIAQGSTVLTSICEPTAVHAEVAAALTISVQDNVNESAPEGTAVNFTVSVTNVGSAPALGVRVHHRPTDPGLVFANVTSLDAGFFQDPNWGDADGYIRVFNSIEPTRTARLFITSQPIAKRGRYGTQATATVPGSVTGPWTAVSTTGIGVVTADLEVNVNPPSGTPMRAINVAVKVDPPVVALPSFQVQVEIDVDPAPFPPLNVSTPDGGSAANVAWFRRYADALYETWVAVFNVAPNYQSLPPGTATVRIPSNVNIQRVRASAGDPGLIDADGAQSSWP